MDDSFKDDLLVLAGHSAEPPDWVNFSREWSYLLGGLGRINSSGVRQFKMSETALDDDGYWRIRAFYNLIEEYRWRSISISIRRSEFEYALRNSGIAHRIGNLNNFYVFTFVQLMDMLHAYSMMSNEWRGSARIRFIFDNQSEKKYILAGWKHYMATKSVATQRKFGAQPRFRSDNDELPLQAADLWAWWVRHWVSTSKSMDECHRKIQRADFGRFTGKTDDVSITHVTITRDSAVEVFKMMAKELPGITRSYGD